MYQTFSGEKHNEQKKVWRPECKLEDNSKRDIKKIEWIGVD